MNVPQFFSPEGLPFGFQLVSGKYCDRILIKFAEYLAAHALIPSEAPMPRINKI